MSPPPVWPVFLAFLTALVVTTIGGMVVAFVLGVLLATGVLPVEGSVPEALQASMGLPVVFTALIAIGAVSTGLVGCIASLLERRPFRERLRLLPVRREAWTVLAGTILLLAAGQVGESLVALGGWGADSVLVTFARVAREAELPTFLVLLVVGSLGAGVAEELLFRGYIQTRLVQRWGVRGGILVTAALFGLMHMDAVHTPLAFLIGLGLGWLTETSGSIRPAIAVHAINNFVSFTLTRAIDTPSSLVPHGVAAASALVVATLGVVAIQRLHAPASAPSAIT